MKKYYLIVLSIITFCVHKTYGQGNTCSQATPFCTSVGVPFTYQNVTGASVGQSGPNYGCLFSEPRPSWFYIKSSAAGVMSYSLTQSTTPGGPPNLDVDYIAYGPFTTAQFPNACNLLTAGNTQGCSYSAAATETTALTATAAGQYFIIMITNYNGGAGYITFTQTGGPNSDCSITCPGSGGITMQMQTYTDYVGGTNVFATNGSTVTCTDDYLMFPYVSLTGGDIVEPCINVEFSPYIASMPTNGNLTVSEGTVTAFQFCPSACSSGQLTGAGASIGNNWGLNLFQLDSTQNHKFVFCGTTGGAASTTTVTLRNCWDNSVIYGGPQTWNLNSASCFTLNVPGGTDIGQAYYTIAPASGASGIYDFYSGVLYIRPSLLIAGTTYTVTYHFKSTDACGFKTSTYVFTVPGSTLTTVPSQTVCSGSAVAATNFTVTPLAGGSVNWTNNNTTIGVAATGSINIAGYTAPVVGTSQVGSFTVSPVRSGCVGPAKTFSITINPKPTLSLSSVPTSTICLNNTIAFTSSGANTYTWSSAGGGGLASTSGTTVGATPTATGTIGYTVNATSAAGCTNTAAQNITVNALPIVVIAPASSGTLCSGTTITLTGSGASSYAWQSPAGGGLSGSGTVVNITPTSSPVTYTLIGTAANTCTNSTVQTITVVATPTVIVSNPSATQSSTLCNGNSVVLTATGAGTFSWTPATGLSATTGSAVTASPTNTASPTIYTVTGTSAAGCVSPASSQGTFTVTVNPLPTISINSTPATSVCLNSSLTFTASGANTYTWSSPAGGGLASTSGANVSATPTVTGNITYTVNATSVAGCTNTAVKTISVSPLPIVVITPASSGTLCSGTSITLTGSGATGYTWQAPAGGGLTGSGSVVSIAPTASPLTYTVIGTAANSCTNSAVKTITVVATPTVTVSNPSATQSSTLCSGNSVVLTATGAGTFSWTPATGLSSTTGNTVTASPTNTTSATIYTVTGTSAAGCVSPAPSQGTFTVTINSTPTITSVSSTSACAGANVSSLSFTVNPSASAVNWANNNTATGLGASGTGSTIAAFTASNVTSATTGVITATASINGCTSLFNHTLTVNPLPILTVSPASQTITCAAPTVTLTGSSNPASATPVWTGGVSSGVNSYTATASSANIYTLTATTLAGCARSATAQVVPSAGLPTVSASITNSLNCNMTTAQVIATTTTNPVSYSWTGSGITGGASTATASVNTGGQYTVVVTNTLSLCSTTVTTFVPSNTTPTTPTISVTGSITCATPTLTLNGSPTSGVTYTWTGAGLISGINTQTAAINAGGTYTLNITNNSNGCVSSQTVSVSTNTSSPTVSLTPTSTYTTTCANPTVALNTAASPSTSVTYSWTSPSTGALNSYTISNPVASGSGIFTVSITNTINGCTGTSATSQATVQITADAGIPVVTLSSNNATITCANQTPSIAVTTTATPVTYSWSPTAGIVPGTETTSTPSFNTPGSYSVIVTNTVSGCASNSGLSVVTVALDNIPPVISSFAAASGGTITCTTTSVIVTPSITPTGNLSYTWTAGPGISNPNQANGIFTAPGIYTLVVTNTVTGCVSTSTNSANTFTVYQNVVTPTVTAVSASSNSVIGCANSTVTFSTNVTASGTNLTYNWSTGATTPTANITTAGAYSVIVTDAGNGCSTTTQFIVTGNTTPPQNVNAGANVNIACGSSSVALNGTTTSTNVTYSWAGPTATGVVSGSTTAMPVVGEPGTYTVTVTDNVTGCQSTSTVNVSQANVTAAFTTDPSTGVAPLTVNFTNTSTGATSFNWNFGDSHTSNGISPSNIFTTGTYTVMLTASSGSCTSTATVVIVVEDGLALEIPNVFTPNNDGSNDIFTIKSTGVKEISLQIFNRWGEKLFEFTGSKAAWDGMTPQGMKVPDATYFYFVKATGFDNTQIEKHGTVNLFR